MIDGDDDVRLHYRDDLQLIIDVDDGLVGPAETYYSNDDNINDFGVLKVGRHERFVDDQVNPYPLISVDKLEPQNLIISRKRKCGSFGGSAKLFGGLANLRYQFAGLRLTKVMIKHPRSGAG